MDLCFSITRDAEMTDMRASVQHYGGRLRLLCSDDYRVITPHIERFQRPTLVGIAVPLRNSGGGYSRELLAAVRTLVTQFERTV